MADISRKIVFGMPSLPITNSNSEFHTNKFIQKLYTFVKAQPIVKVVEIINRLKFAKAVLDKNTDIFLIHVTIVENESVILIHSFDVLL